MKIVECILLLMLVVTAVGALNQKSSLLTVISFTAFGLIMSVIWMLLQAPDLAVTPPRKTNEGDRRRQMKIFDFITAWVDGGKSVPLDTSLSGVREKKAASPRRRLSDRESFAEFMKLYKGCCIVICVLMVVVLLIGAVTLPVFGDPGNPTNNEVVRRYVGSAESETGVENVIAGMILNYRGFDTFGESCVLFLAVCCVMLLLWPTSDRIRDEQADTQLCMPACAAVCSCVRRVYPL